MLLIWNHVGYRTQLFAAFVTLALLGGTLQVFADADSIASFESPSGVRIEYGFPLHRSGQWSGLAHYKSNLRIHRMGEPRGSNIRIHRMGEPRGSKIRIHRAGT